MDIYILRDGSEKGPFTEEAVHQLLKEGAVRIGDAAWRPGMPEWIPLQDILYPPLPPPVPVAPPPPALSHPVERAPASAEPASAKQKAFLSYMGIAYLSSTSRDQAALLVNEVMEDPKQAGRLARWNDDRLRLHPELFTAEISARKEGRAQQFYERCQTEGAEVVDGVAKAHCQVLVGYLDVKFPNWDAHDHEATWSYFFPAIADKFPQLVRKEWRDKLHYPKGPKVSHELQRKTAAVSGRSHGRNGPSPFAGLARGLILGVLLLAVATGVVYIMRKPLLVEGWKKQLAAMLPAAKPASATAPGATSSVPVPPPAASLDAIKPPSSPPPKPDGSSVATNVTVPPESPPAAGAPPMNGMAEGGSPAATPGTPSLFDPLTASAPPGTTAGADAGAPPLPVLAQPRTSVTLTKPYEVQFQYGKMKIPAGTTLRLIGQEGTNLRVGFQNREVLIPAESTDLGSGLP